MHNHNIEATTHDEHKGLASSLSSDSFSFQFNKEPHCCWASGRPAAPASSAAGALADVSYSGWPLSGRFGLFGVGRQLEASPKKVPGKARRKRKPGKKIEKKT